MINSSGVVLYFILVVMKNFVKSIALLMLGTLSVHASLPQCATDQPELQQCKLDDESLGQVILTSLLDGAAPSDNMRFLLKFPTQDNHPGSYYQLVENKDGFSKIFEEAVDSEGRKTNLSSLYATKVLLEHNVLKLATGDTDIFPKHPILYINCNERPSLSCLTFIPKQQYYADLASIKFAFEEEATRSLLIRSLAKNCFASCMSIPEYFKRGFEVGIFSHDTTQTDYLEFNQAKEELFTMLYEVSSNLKEPLPESEFFKLILKMDTDFTKTFWKMDRYLTPEDEIFKGLNCTIPFVRDTYAKALLLSVFVHPNDWVFPELGKSSLVFTQSYAHAARWLDHIDPEYGYSHIYAFAEYQRVVHSTITKSHWVLKRGVFQH